MRNNYVKFDEIIAKAKEGDEVSKVELIERLSPLIKYSIKKYCPIYKHYEDLYQDGVLIILECLKLHDDSKANFQTMVKSYLKYHYIETLKYIKNTEKDISKSKDDEDIVNSLSSNINIEEDFEKLSELSYLKKILKSLTYKQRRIIIMYYYKDMTHKEIAKKLKISVWTVINTKRRAIEILKEEYNVIK